MKLTLIALVTPLLISGCASTVQTTAAEREELNGFVRVTNNGRELFCREDRGILLLREGCYTRKQMKDRWLARRLALFATPSSPAEMVPNYSPYTFYNASGH